MPQMPVIEWTGPFPEEGAVFEIEYGHKLIERARESIYYYPFRFITGDDIVTIGSETGNGNHQPISDEEIREGC